MPAPLTLGPSSRTVIATIKNGMPVLMVNADSEAELPKPDSAQSISLKGGIVELKGKYIVLSVRIDYSDGSPPYEIDMRLPITSSNAEFVDKFLDALQSGRLMLIFFVRGRPVRVIIVPGPN